MSELPFERALRAWTRAAGIGWERLRYARPGAGGDTLAHRLSPPGEPRGVVLLVHGAGNDALFGMVGLAKALLRRDFEVFTFDLDGHGRENATVLSAAVADAVPAAVRAAAATERGLPLHAVGVSLGGSVLLHCLPRLAGTVASAALLSAPLRVRFSTRAALAELRPRLAHTLWRNRAHYGLTGLVPSFGRYKRDVYPLRLASPPPPGAFGYVAALNRILADLELPDAARRADLPVLLVYGAADRLVPPEQGRTLLRLLPRAELVVLPRETHLTAPLAAEAERRVAEWVRG